MHYPDFQENNYFCENNVYRSNDGGNEFTQINKKGVEYKMCIDAVRDDMMVVGLKEENEVDNEEWRTMSSCGDF